MAASLYCWSLIPWGFKAKLILFKAPAWRQFLNRQEKKRSLLGHTQKESNSCVGFFLFILELNVLLFIQQFSFQDFLLILEINYVVAVYHCAFWFIIKTKGKCNEINIVSLCRLTVTLLFFTWISNICNFHHSTT